METQKIKEEINRRISEADYQIEFYDGEEDAYSQEITMRYLSIKHELNGLLDFINKLSK